MTIQKPNRISRNKSRPSQIITRSAAIARYEADQHRMETQTDVERARRALGVLAVMLKAVNNVSGRLHGQIVDMGKPFSSAVVDLCLFVASKGFAKARSFIGAHCLLWLWPWGKHYKARLSTCDMCSFRTADAYSKMRCGGENGGKGCGCLQSPSWPFSRLRYKLALRNWICPLGHFGRWHKGAE